MLCILYRNRNTHHLTDKFTQRLTRLKIAEKEYSVFTVRLRESVSLKCGFHPFLFYSTIYNIRLDYNLFTASISTNHRHLYEIIEINYIYKVYVRKKNTEKITHPKPKMEK